MLHDTSLGNTADGGLTKSGTGVTTLSGTNTYTGGTTVSGGTLLISGVTGTNIVTVNTNATLSGNGTLNGATTVALGGTVQPGLGNGDTSTLTISNSLTLAGNALFSLNRNNAQNASKVAGLSNVNFGGILTVTNTGAALAGGDTFVLFSSTAYSGNFASLILPPLNPGLVWNTNNLAVNGSIAVVTVLPTTLALVSSANPAGYLDPLIFTATVTPTNAPGVVTFYNGATPFSTNSLVAGVASSSSLSTLARGTNTITASYLGNIFFYGSTNSLNQVVTNHPPVASLASFTRNFGIAVLRIKVSDLATNASDVDGDAITLVSIGSSTNGALAFISGGNVLYYNPNNVNDTFTYTVQDSFGDTASGNVSIIVNSAGIFGQSNPQLSTANGIPTVTFSGIPGYSYTVQRSTNLVGWVSLWTTNAPALGLFDYTDNFGDLGAIPVSAYYRLQYNP